MYPESESESCTQKCPRPPRPTPVHILVPSTYKLLQVSVSGLSFFYFLLQKYAATVGIFSFPILSYTRGDVWYMFMGFAVFTLQYILGSFTAA